MSVLESDIIVYGSANMQETDSGTQGGAIDTSRRVEFNVFATSAVLEAVSENSGDTTQTMTVVGLTASGAPHAPSAVTLTGQTPVQIHATAFERVFKGVKSATCAGAVALQSNTNTHTGTAQSGSAQRTASKMAFIKLASGASGLDDAYKGMVIRTTGGTGPNQIRRCIKYNGTTKEAFVDRDWGTLPDNTTTYTVREGLVFEKNPAEVLQIRAPFYDVASDVEGGSARDYYEKAFIKNVNAESPTPLDLTAATVTEGSDPTGLVTFALETTLGGSGTSTNRVTVPASGVSSFDSASKNVANSQVLSAGSAQGIWLKFSLPAGQAAVKSSYSPRTQGSSI